VVYVNASFINYIYHKLQKKPIGFRESFSYTSKFIKQIVIWALISATVGILLRALEGKFKQAGRIASSVIGGIWSLVTIYVIPILIFENAKATDALKKSGHLFKKTWGENVIASFSISLIFVALGALGIIPLALVVLYGFSELLIMTIVFVVLYWILLAIVSSTMSSIFQTVLYIYATTKQVPSIMDANAVKSAFAPKKQSLFKKVQQGS